MTTRRICLGTALLCCVIFSSCSVKEKTIGRGENIHHDDFEYSVQHVEKAEQIGSLRARGAFLIVEFQVENRARQVNHRWSNGIAFVVAANGTQYENEINAQTELNRVKPFNYKQEHITPAGASESTKLVFDIPQDAETYLKVRGSVLMGDMFDGDQYRRTRVKLF
jgi:hypothetical protein